MVNLRPFQQRSVNRFQTSSKRRFLLPVTPGGGKSAVPYLAGLHLPKGLVTAGCWLVPRESLRDQAGRVPRIILEYSAELGIAVPEFRAALNERNPRRGCFGYVTTYQSVAADPDLHWQEFERPGVNYALFLDESQFLAENSWTAAVQELVDRATVVVLMSGTPYRGDGKPCAFWPYHNLSGGGQTINYDHPDYETIGYSRLEALRDRAILPVELILTNARGEFITSRAEQIRFNSFADMVDERDARGALYTAVSKDAGREITRRMLENWGAYKRSRNPSAQTLIVVDSQARAVDYQGWMRQDYPGVKVGLAISDNANSRSAVRSYCDGKLDALITVGMAHVGMDAPAASHMALLTIIRQRGWIEQALARVVRPNEKAGPWETQTAVIYTFDDPMMKAIARDIEVEQAEFLDSEDEPGDPSSDRNSPERGNLIPLFGEATEVRAHELNRVQLDPETSMHFERVAAARNIAVTPIEFHRLVQDALGLPAEEIQQRAAPLIGRREREDALRKAIETLARQTDGIRNVDFGTTNSDCIRYFGKSRSDMGLTELNQVWQWMQEYRNRWAG